MTQRDQILQMLKDAGDRGVTSQEFYDAYLPRFPARIHELKNDFGYDIGDMSEGRFKRYKLRADSPSSLGGPEGTAAGLPRLDTERAGRDDLTPSAPHLPDRSEVAGETQETYKVDVHRSPLKVASGSETPAISDRSCLNPYEYEAGAA